MQQANNVENFKILVNLLKFPVTLLVFFASLHMKSATKYLCSLSTLLDQKEVPIIIPPHIFFK